MSKPLCIDLFCGLGGWANGFLAEGYDVIGFDIERHVYGEDKYPGQLVLQDVRTLHGSQFRKAAVIVASPPCQAYSYRAMPWRKLWLENARMDDDGAPAGNYIPPDPIHNDLFRACFRIAEEAGLPIVIENVKGAQKFMGSAKWHYGSFYLWGDVPALMPPVSSLRKSRHVNLCETPAGGATSWFHGNSKHEGRFYGEKTSGHVNKRDGASHTRHLTNQAEHVKVSGDWFGSYADMKANGTISPERLHGKGSSERKAASAQIAKIPPPLASWIARVFKPT